ncbi:ferritin-like domain-containing protein [Elizabethkingia meningoseptica]|uniref:ferritin-like domain-containing protein n=1 Tax=Elizabethkingia meningoseptica TaxID=238 RepID=UPI0008412524|nr:ferritin-like domain-containing protein [Elizabethkingia meningoseptica]ODM55321.1 Tat (twin-arginine translocation) pathway signal sequence containing protein [Elizabethkingia meningoseptica]OHT30526.1 Tat (twin-arginine translocation) pathway signal sequence containing protein [Elizabethkingia meningoseptica]OPC15558.1 Tat (twin-arginine translocation) pathway signal sequence containing protein [Elizabethkingia meningoseptica]
MKKTIHISNPDSTLDTSRRNFLKLGGISIAMAGLIMVGCNDGDGLNLTDNMLFDLGEGDVGVLNYAYALEQLEADFYTKVVNNFYSGISSIEKETFTDLYHHEVIHRDFFKAAISGATSHVLPKLEFQYPNVNFNDRNSVLATAKALEDTGVAAYNAAGKYITNPAYLVIAGKIVSVEARHASAIRNLINPGSADFSGDDVVDSNGLDVAKEPKDIIMAAGGFIKTRFTWKERGIS